MLGLPLAREQLIRSNSNSTLEYDDFRVKFRLTGLPVAGNFVRRDTEIE